MKVAFENVDLNSNSGPNSFGLKLYKEFLRKGIGVDYESPDVRLAFIQTVFDKVQDPKFSHLKDVPYVLRLDGINFNTDFDWQAQNSEIKRSYDSAAAVILQSEFNLELVNRFFGERENCHVINNGTDFASINSIGEANFEKQLSNYDDYWLCASHWRPHKRLADNIEFFRRNSSSNTAMLVAGKIGENIDRECLSKDNVFYLGELNWPQLISCMKLASHFIHLAWLDHCPNVVVDAKACGCKIVVSSAGGTVELTSTDDIVLKDPVFVYRPVKLYDPPALSFDDFYIVQNNPGKSINIDLVSNEYAKVLESVKV